ncbi:MAG: phosphoribosylanthranilate isomerase [Paracoccaceae bacterium]
MNVKICGLRDAANLSVAIDAGARYVGFVFFAKSPRHVDIAAARALALAVPDGVAKVALTVNADDTYLDAINAAVPLDMLQLHGQESVERVLALRQRYGLPIMKAVGVAEESDLASLQAYGAVADQLLVDAKPPKGATLPGGNGLAFDWRLIANRRWPVPWMLAGGLTAENVGEAIRLTGAKQVDVSSGVESTAGVKDPARIRDFIVAASA